MTNQTFTTPCGTTYHVGQELHNYTEAGPLLDYTLDYNRKSDSWLLWYSWHLDRENCCGVMAPHMFPITITALPPQPEPEPETVSLDEVRRDYLDVWIIFDKDVKEITNHWFNNYHDRFSNYYTLKAHTDAGGKLYKTREDAERGKALGWK